MTDDVIDHPREHPVDLRTRSGYGTTMCGVAPRLTCPRCQREQLDEVYGNHGDDCPGEEHRHLVCTNPDCQWTFLGPPLTPPRNS